MPGLDARLGKVRNVVDGVHPLDAVNKRQLDALNTTVGNSGIKSVLDYGAVNDGVTDDSLAFIRAKNAGKFIVVPDTGTPYKCDETLQLDGHILWGLGQPTIISEVGKKLEETVTLTFSATSGTNITVTASAPYFFDDQWNNRDVRIFDTGTGNDPKFFWFGTRISETQITGCAMLAGINYAAGETLAGTGPYAWEYGRVGIDMKSFSQVHNIRLITTINSHQSRYPNARWGCGISLGDPWMLNLRDDEITEYCVVKNVHVHCNELENRNAHGLHCFGWVENCLFENVLVTGKTNFAIVCHWSTDTFYNEQAYTAAAWSPVRNTFRNCHAFINLPFDLPVANVGNDIRILTKSWWDSATTGQAVTISSSASRLPTPLQPATTYYLIKRPAPTTQAWYCVQLAATSADATAGTAISLGVLGTGEAGTITITKVSGGSASQCLPAITKTGRNGFRLSGAAFTRFEGCSTDFGEGFEIFPGDRPGYAQNIDPNDTCAELAYIDCVSYDPDGFGFQCAANGNVGGTYGSIANSGGPNDIWYGNQYGVNSSLLVQNCRVVYSRDYYTRSTGYAFSWMNRVSMPNSTIVCDNASMTKYGLALYAITDFSCTDSFISSRLACLVRNVQMGTFINTRLLNGAVNYASTNQYAFSLGANERTASLYSALATGDDTIYFNQFASGGTATASMKLTTVSVFAAGSGYAVGNTLTVAGGTSTTTATVTVSSVNGSGGVTAVTVATAGVYTVLPSNTNTVTGGAGTGCRLTLRWGVDSLTIGDAGSGMFDAPRVVFVLAAADNPSSTKPAATATLTTTGADDGESLASLTVTDSGDNMTTIPTVVISDGGTVIVPGTIIAYEVTGTATAGASTTLTDSGKAWTTDQFIDYTVEITGGTGVGQSRRITANTGTVLTVASAWDTNPDATSTYLISGSVTSRDVATQEQEFDNIDCKIWPARVAIPSGATVKIRSQTSGLTIHNCEIEGFSYGLRTAGTIPNRNIKITENLFRGLGYFNVDLTAAINATVEGNTFTDTGRTSATADTRVIQIGNYAKNINIRGNTFSEVGKAKFLVYVTASAKQVSITDNDFNTPNNGESSASALFLTNSDNSLFQITEEGNRFGPLVTTKRNGTSAGRYLFDGSITQASNKSTGVTLNTRSGSITMNGAALAANTTVSFVLTSTGITANDEISIRHDSAGTLGAYVVSAVPANGSATIYVRNVTAGSLSEAIVLKFLIRKRQ